MNKSIVVVELDHQGYKLQIEYTQAGENNLDIDMRYITGDDEKTDRPDITFDILKEVCLVWNGEEYTDIENIPLLEQVGARMLLSNTIEYVEKLFKYLSRRLGK